LHTSHCQTHIGGLIVYHVHLGALDNGFEPRSGQTKGFKIGISCFSTEKLLSFGSFGQAVSEEKITMWKKS